MDEGSSYAASSRRNSPFSGGYENANKPSQGSTSGGNGDAGSFECNICLELAQDPIVTLCGHLFCWPCLYKWLHVHSQSQECPVCKAIVEEDKLVPLYGRGKVGSQDPRSKSVPGVNIPNRPAGRRPGTAPPPPPNNFHHQSFGFGAPPMASARVGNFTVSAGFGLFPALFGFHMHSFPDGVGYPAAPGYSYGYSNHFHGGHGHHHPYNHHVHRGTEQDAVLSKYLMIIGVLVLFFFLFV
eukprot:TRINITY_DN6046_c0_g2_i1.p1 TRINITY_DN6046_c0_g2~~TRINITY_DN6046_c0_g2_i1.p1  ORF type:complete len:270 (-),score=44.05 TRINITY_DN6046_c0_g2_i1:256-975(-)